nr:MAG TPA: helix-turn-helix domain protein [Caudoviricetes sp.]
MKNYLSSRRKELKLTQPQVAERAKLSNYTVVQRYERGVVMPSVEIALRLAKALETTVENLFELDD